MGETVVIIILVGGLLLAYGLMRWINWYTWGENRAKKEALERRMQERQAKREEEEGDKSAGQGNER